MTEIEIRSYLDEDESAVAQLWREVFPEAPTWNRPEDDIRRKLAIQRELFLVAERKNEIVGSAMAGYDGIGVGSTMLASARHAGDRASERP